MAIIHIKGKRDSIIINNERAKKVRDMWMDESTNPEKKLDLGEWIGTFGQIKSIEFDQEVKENPDPFAPGGEYYLTPEEQKEADEAREKLNKWMKERVKKTDIGYMRPAE